jgi:hypothetical protein
MGQLSRQINWKTSGIILPWPIMKSHHSRGKTDDICEESRSLRGFRNNRDKRQVAVSFSEKKVSQPIWFSSFVSPSDLQLFTLLLSQAVNDLTQFAEVLGLNLGLGAGYHDHHHYCLIILSTVDSVIKQTTKKKSKDMRSLILRSTGLWRRTVR